MRDVTSQKACSLLENFFLDVFSMPLLGIFQNEVFQFSYMSNEEVVVSLCYCKNGITNLA